MTDVEPFGIKDEIASWASASDKVRDVGKWMAVTSGALAALLIGTAPLTGLSKLSGLASLLWPLIWATTALLGVIAIVAMSTSVLAPTGVTMSDLTRNKRWFKKLKHRIGENPTAYFGMGISNVEQFIREGSTDFKALSNIDNLIAGGTVTVQDDINKLKEAREVIVKRLDAYGQHAARLLAIASFHKVYHSLSRLRWVMFVAGIVVIIGIVGFLISVGPATSDKNPTHSLALVSLTPKGISDNSTLLGPGCRNPFRGVIVSGGASGPWNLVVADASCTAGTLTLNKDQASVMRVFDP